MQAKKPCLVVVSPFVDKQHGTERRVAEWLNQLIETFDIHLFSQRVDDLDLSRIRWHRIPKCPGPHLLAYSWWFAANHFCRLWNAIFRGLNPDLVFSPGINCLDADVMSVHVVFGDYRRRNASMLRFENHPLRNWPLLLHRKLYYSFIAHLERLLYAKRKKTLIPISQKTAMALKTFYGRTDRFPVVYQGIDHGIFNPARRIWLRDEVRRAFHLSPGQFVLLLIGNDWRNKGLHSLLEARALLRELPLQLLVVGQDVQSTYFRCVEENQCVAQVHFLPSRRDVEFYYAAADAYCGPSLEDAFGQPPAEAMACGLPVITSVTNGTSEIIEDGVDGLLLRNPTDSKELASLIRKLYENPRLREEMGAKAAEKMLQFTWEKSGREMTNLLLQALEAKKSRHASVLRQET